MPELAEVEITRLKLLPLVRGRRILDFWTDWPRGLKSEDRARGLEISIRNRKILDITRRGKVLFFELSGRPARKMAVHLRMSGRLSVVKAKTPESNWTHFLWSLSGGRELRFIDPRKFGVVWYGDEKDFERDKYLKTLGRDARSVPYPLFADVLRKKSGMIKAVLLRQDVLSGVGNIMADETLWRAKIHPRAKIARLGAGDFLRLHKCLGATITAMLASGGTSMRNFRHPDGGFGGYQEKRKIYGKAGQPCPRCKIKLQRLTVAGRGTTVCPKCQKI